MRDPRSGNGYKGPSSLLGRDGVLKDGHVACNGSSAGEMDCQMTSVRAKRTSVPVRLYVHLTWTTLQRQPLINRDVVAFLRRFLPREAQRHGGRLLAAGIVGDHVHLVLRLPPVTNIPRMVQGFKGASARIANRDGLMPRAPLRWAEGYDLRSVGVRQLGTVVEYVEQQAGRHPNLAVK